MTTILIALIFLSIIVMVHELGHFLVGKAVGIYAEEFSIGMGPRLLKFSGKETVYSLRALPIGGYVKFLGEDADSNEPRAFNNVSLWKRAMVLVAGPLMNFVLAILLFSIMFMSFGIYIPTPTIENVVKDSAAAQAGMVSGDRIIAVNDQSIKDMDDQKAVEKLRDIISKSNSKPLTITILRNGKSMNMEVIPQYNEKAKAYLIGIEFGVIPKRLNFFSAVGLSIKQTGKIIVMMIQMLGNLLFKHENLDQVMGPIGIVGEIGKAAKQGVEQLLGLGIVISANLGIINLIPFPALDGGRLLLIIIEAVRGKPMNPEKEGYINLIGFALLMLLMILVTFQDITR